MLLKNRLQQLSANGQALLATNFYNFETLSGILKAAKATNSEIILQVSESTLDYLGVELSAKMALTSLQQYGVTGWLHLDHGSTLAMAKRCLDAGFDSVMIDASEKPINENIKITSEVVKYAEQFNANVEAELGYIAKLGQKQIVSQYTQPFEAKQFVEATGVHALAIAVGTAHGFYKEAPKLQIELIAQIHQATTAALVLHGGSGIPALQLQEAIRNGISKINLATETKNIFMKTLQKILSETDEIDLRKVFPKATDSVVELISDKLKVVLTA